MKLKQAWNIVRYHYYLEEYLKHKGILLLEIGWITVPFIFVSIFMRKPILTCVFQFTALFCAVMAMSFGWILRKMERVEGEG